MPTKLSLTLEAAQYRQQLEEVIRRTRQAAAQMEAAVNNTPASQPAQTASQAASRAAQSASQAADNAANSISQSASRAARSVSQAAGQSALSMRAVWQNITSLNGGAKQLVSTMLAGGGLIGIAMAGVQSVIKLCTMALDAMAAKGKEAAESHRQFADSTAEAAANSERLKQSSNEAITQLAAMANAAKLSNAEQEKAVSLIAQLTRQYGDLGLSVDKATGKIKGLGSAIVAKQTKDTRNQLKSIEAQLKERRNARDQEDQNISGAGWNVGRGIKAASRFSLVGRVANSIGLTDWFNRRTGLDQTQIGGEQDAKEAAARRAADDKKIMELEMQRREAKKKLAELAKKQLEQTRIQNAALEEEKKERDKQARYRAADNELSRLADPDAKIANRQALIDSEKQDNDALRARTAAAKADMARYAPGSKEADAQKYADAQQVYLRNAAEQAKSDEKIANWQNQITQLQYEQAEAKKKMVDQAAFELEYNRLIAAGEYDKAAALKLEHELKQRNQKLSEDEKKAILDAQKAKAHQEVGRMFDQLNFELDYARLIAKEEYDRAAALKLQYELKQKNLQMTEAQKKAYLESEKEKGRMAVGKMLVQSKFELDYARAIAAGEYDRAAALKLQYDLQQKNLQMTEAQKKATLEQQQAQKALNLQTNNRDKALDLKWRAMEKAGRGWEASEQRALRDAERTKGSNLTEDEVKATKKLHQLTWQFDHLRDPQFGDLGIQTNSLTARGGFATGAAAPDPDKYNRLVLENNKQMLGIVQRIESLCRDFGKF